MKRLILALIILVVMVGFGIWEQVFLDKVFDELDAKITDIQTILDNGNDSKQNIDELVDWWNDKSKVLDALVVHNEIKEVTLLIYELDGYSQADMDEDRYAAVVRVKEVAESTRKLLGYKAEHIF